MKLKYELLANAAAEAVREKIKMVAHLDASDELNVDVNEIADTTAIKALSEIQEIIQNDNISDFNAMEQIVLIFEKYKLDTGTRHDFG